MKKVNKIMLLSAVGVALLGAVTGCDDNSDSSENSSQSSKPKSNSQNLPNQKINKDTATDHDFYWASKSDKKIRYFVDDDKKITAIKVVLKPNVNNTWWCEQYMKKVLHDDNLKFGNDKQSSDDGVLSNDGKYNVYSPKYKKWYWVRFDPANDVGKKDDMVSSFAIYPGKSDEAQ